jgi:hypothetical protein
MIKIPTKTYLFKLHNVAIFLQVFSLLIIISAMFLSKGLDLLVSILGSVGVAVSLIVMGYSIIILELRRLLDW